MIRLRDGETNLLAGLIQQASSDTVTGVAGLMDIPGVGRVFSGNSMENRETEIVMTLTPRIVRIPDITEDDTNDAGVDVSTLLGGVNRC